MRTILFLFIFFSFSLQAQNTWFVKNNGTGNGNSWANASNNLQLIINNATDGDEIWIAEGTYQPIINTAFTLTKNVSLYGGFPNTGSPQFLNRNPHSHPTILQGNQEHVLRVQGSLNNRLLPTTIIDGFSITNGMSNYGGGLLIYYCDAEFKNLKIYNNTALHGEGGGIKIDYSNSKFIQVLVTNNNTHKIPGTDGDSGGIRIGNSAPTFINCVIANNHADGYIGGVYSLNNSQPKFYNTIIYGNTANVSLGGIYPNDNYRGNNSAEFKNCILEDSGGSDKLNLNAKWKYGGIDLGGNWDVDPLFNTDYTVQPNSFAINKGDNASYPTTNGTDLKQQNRFQDIIDIGVMEHQSPAHPILYVKQGGTGDGTSWVNASGDLQGMIDKQMKGNVVWVAKGTYEPINGEIYFKMRDSIQILGGFDNTGNPTLQDRDINLHETILTSSGGSVIGNYLYANRFLSNTAILDGFTLLKNNLITTPTSGTIDSYSNAVYKNITFKNFDYTGSYGREDSSNTFINCIYIDNNTYNAGAGPAFLHSSKATFEGCTFTNNDNFGGVIQAKVLSEITVKNCIFNQNQLNSGGASVIALWSSKFNIDSCIFSNNLGSAIQATRDIVQNPTQDSYGDISNSTFRNNSNVALWIAMNDTNTKISVSNCLFYNNDSRGAVFIGGIGNVYFTNCTLTKNYRRRTGGGGAFIGSGNVYFRNCILYDNAAQYYYLNEIHHYPPNANVNFQNSIVKGSGGSFNWNTQYFGNDLGGNLDIDPKFNDVEANDFSLAACSPAINAGSNSFYGANLTPDLSGVNNDIAGNNRFTNTVDMGAFEFNGSPHSPTTYYVNALATGTNDGTSWQNAFVKIENALSKACEDDEIWVAEGTYTPQKGKAFKMLNKVNMYGGFPSTGNPTMNDRNWNKYQTILEGNENSVFINYFSEEFPLTNETIIDGFILENGIGNNMINVGLAGGAICNTNASPTLRNLIIRNNSAYGGAAIYNLNNSAPILINCLLHGNSYTGPNTYGSVIFNFNTSNNTKLINCTLVNNKASAITNYNQPTVLVYNSIIFNNIKGYASNFKLAIVYTNCIVGDNLTNNIWDNNYGINGGNNLNQDPNLYNYHLPSHSVAIDKGNNTFFTQHYTGKYDLQMSDRFHNSRIDLGAYEFNPLLSLQNPGNSSNIKIYPNPVTDRLFIEYESAEISALKVFSINGKEVLSSTITPELNIENLNPGAYILCLYNKNTLLYCTKIVKK